MYTYIKTDKGLYIIGFYDFNGYWHLDSECNAEEDAISRVGFLNGKLADSLIA